jgi:hypothetical protein
VRGRQTEAKALIDVAAPEDQPEIGCVRMRPIADASAETLLPFVQNSVEAWQPCSHRRLAGLHTSGRQRLRSPSHVPEGKEGDALGTDAGSPPRDFPPEAVAAGDGPRSGQSGALGLLPGRIPPRFNRRKSCSGDKLLFRLLQQAVVDPAPYKKKTVRCYATLRRPSHQI